MPRKRDPNKPKKTFWDYYKHYDPSKEGYGNPEKWKASFNFRIEFEAKKEKPKRQSYSKAKGPKVVERATPVPEKINRIVLALIRMSRGTDLEAQTAKIRATELCAKYNLDYELFQQEVDLEYRP